MIFSNGFIYRWGVRIKEFGERMGHVRLFGIHIFNWCCGPVINLGYAIIKSVANRPIREM
jgi:hypothetical protein